MNTKPVGIVGGGLMGAGIATKFALAGHEALVLEASPQRRATIPAVIEGILQELQAAGAVSAAESAAALARISLIDGLPALASAPLVIEVIPEVLAAKQELYRQLEAVLAPDALLASNTSGFLPDALSAGLARPERFLITHFWNPPHAIPLVEIVPGARTAPAALEQTVALLRAIGAEPVVLRKAVPGFIGNRLQFAVLREALHLVQTGVADAETIDTVMKASLGRRYAIAGPLESADLGGLETILKVGTHLLPAITADGSGLELLRAHIAKGETGAASGQGFYQWTDERRAAMRQKRITYQLPGRIPPAKGG
ncbi:MAG TPA: 3-hydroxyacyl-CoA dehydrogenase family protein [Lacunisphaera sp.]|jgi:3-hydroxybutyryl-CoA dehydrogenase|nr:3-hydroxyacyl-CoA dehydrogenase family protein [Lacunisphaera sp.]HQY05729.1 3-hydroxyacyl-CoA dehydrogenase family protein [Lacunisphaera sp.]